MSTTHIRSCHLCESMCGVEITVNEGRVTRVRPNRDDVWSRGHICPKGTTIGRLHEDPDRLRAPMIREGDVWRAATWDEAFARCEELIHGVLQRHGRKALASRTGNMVGRNFMLSRYAAAFSMLARIPRYTSSTVDQMPKNVACQLMFGDSWRIPVPDIANTDFFLLMGANPHASQGSILAFPDVLGEIRRIRERGGRTVVIDPVRTETAKLADEWIPIVPGTDALLLLAITHVLFADGLVEFGELVDLVNGVDDLRALSAAFTPERVAPVCGVPAEVIRRLAHDLRAARAAAVYGRIGLCTQEFGTLASWLVDVVAIVSGNFDRPGTSMFPRPLAPFMELMGTRAPSFGTWRSRVRGAPEVLGEVPASCFAEEIDTPGNGQIKGVINIASNPVVSAPDSARLDAALGGLECMISVDAYLNQTTRHSHVILPATSALEQPYFDIWSWMFALRSGSKFHEPLFESPSDWVPEWQVMLRLGALCAGKRNDEIDIARLDDDFFSFLCRGAGVDPSTLLAEHAEPGPMRICDLAVRMGPWGDRFGERPEGLTLDDVRAAPNGVDLGPAVPRLREILRTESGRVELAPPYITADLERLSSLFERERPPLVLVSRRHVRSLNSWMHNVEVLMKGRDRSGLRIHPSDAARFGLVDGEAASVTTSAGTVTVIVDVSDDISPGVVSLPHGWGHDVDGVRLQVAQRYPGVNSNLLSPADLLDVPSGNAVLNGIPVTVEPGSRSESRPSNDHASTARPLLRARSEDRARSDATEDSDRAPCDGETS